MRRCALLLAALVASGCGGGERSVAERAMPQADQDLPSVRQSIPREPRCLAGALEDTNRALYAAIDRWRAGGDPSRGGPPSDVTLLALYHQRIYLLLSTNHRLCRRTLAQLPPRRRAEARDNVLAKRELAAIKSVVKQRVRIRIGRAEPADVLRQHYRRAWRRFRVGWPLLAAVNFVESAFGRLRNESVSGAQGPMQFMPATWRAYGMGGDVRAPRDAILGAANYLRASGAPRDERRALYAYNPSRHYVSAVRRYARRIRADQRAYYAYYSWQVFVRTGSGYRRLTGPARAR